MALLRRDLGLFRGELLGCLLVSMDSVPTGMPPLPGARTPLPASSFCPPQGPPCSRSPASLRAWPWSPQSGCPVPNLSGPRAHPRSGARGGGWAGLAPGPLSNCLLLHLSPARLGCVGSMPLSSPPVFAPSCGASWNGPSSALSVSVSSRHGPSRTSPARTTLRPQLPSAPCPCLPS